MDPSIPPKDPSTPPKEGCLLDLLSDDLLRMIGFQLRVQAVAFSLTCKRVNSAIAGNDGFWMIMIQEDFPSIIKSTQEGTVVDYRSLYRKRNDFSHVFSIALEDCGTDESSINRRLCELLGELIIDNPKYQIDRYLAEIHNLRDIKEPATQLFFLHSGVHNYDDNEDDDEDDDDDDEDDDRPNTLWLEFMNELIRRDPAIWKEIRRGDVVKLYEETYRNEWTVMWDGTCAVALGSDLDDYGNLPRGFAWPEFPLHYFLYSINHNFIVRLSAKITEEIKAYAVEARGNGEAHGNGEEILGKFYVEERDQGTNIPKLRVITIPSHRCIKTWEEFQPYLEMATPDTVFIWIDIKSDDRHEQVKVYTLAYKFPILVDPE